MNAFVKNGRAFMAKGFVGPGEASRSLRWLSGAPQAAWRGALVRSRDGKRKKEARRRVAAATRAAPSQPHRQLGARAQAALQVLLASSQITQVPCRLHPYHTWTAARRARGSLLVAPEMDQHRPLARRSSLQKHPPTFSVDIGSAPAPALLCLPFLPVKVFSAALCTRAPVPAAVPAGHERLRCDRHVHFRQPRLLPADRRKRRLRRAGAVCARLQPQQAACGPAVASDGHHAQPVPLPRHAGCRLLRARLHRGPHGAAADLQRQAGERLDLVRPSPEGGVGLSGFTGRPQAMCTSVTRGGSCVLAECVAAWSGCPPRDGAAVEQELTPQTHLSRRRCSCRWLV
jgi:hypothetical protein